MLHSKQWLFAGSVLFLILVPMLALTSIGTIFMQGFDITNIGPIEITHDLAPPHPSRAIFWWLATLGPLSLWLIALMRLFQLFRSFIKGRYLNLEAIALLRAFALYTVITVLAAISLSGVVDWSTDPERHVATCFYLSISGEQAQLLFMAGLILVISGVLLEGEAFKRETEEYV